MSSSWNSPSSLKWKRPASVSMGTTWARFEGKPLPPGQVVPRFRIQDVTDDLMEPVLQHMKNNFLRDAPYHRFIGSNSDPEIVQSMLEVWRWVLSHRIALVCLLDNADDLEDKSVPSIAGCNLTYPIFPDSPAITISYAAVKNIRDMVTKVRKTVDCFEKYQVDVILYSVGLSVDPLYRGQGIAEHLLRARLPLARALGIKVTIAVFSGNISQAAGRKAGYEVLGEILNKEFLVDGKSVFAGVQDSRCMQLQARIVPEK